MLSKQPGPPAAAESTDSPANTHVEPVLNAEALGRLTELDPTGETRLLERVLQAFKASVARLRPQLEAAGQTGDRAAIRLVAHTLKSSSASIGAMRLSQLCVQIETAIRLESDEDLSEPLVNLGAALDEAIRAIDMRLEERA